MINQTEKPKIQYEFYPSDHLKKVKKKLIQISENQQKIIHYNIDGSLESEYTLLNGKRDGEEITYYENGTDMVHYIYTYKEDILEGPFQEFYDNESNSLKSESNYINDKEEGEFFGYHLSGEIESKGEYKNGQIEGDYNRYFPNGDIKIKSFMKKGKYDGIYIEYYPNGKNKKEYNYKNGKLDGEQKEYYLSGNIKKITNPNIKSEMSYKDGEYEYDIMENKKLKNRHEEIEEMYFGL